MNCDLVGLNCQSSDFRMSVWDLPSLNSFSVINNPETKTAMEEWKLDCAARRLRTWPAVAL